MFVAALGPPKHSQHCYLLALQRPSNAVNGMNIIEWHNLEPMKVVKEVKKYYWTQFCVSPQGANFWGNMISK